MTDRVYQYSLSAWNLSSLSYDNVSFDVSSQSLAPHGIAFNSDGSKMYIAGYATSNIYSNVYQYSLKSWDLSTAEYRDSFNVSNECTEMSDVTFRDNGRLMYVVSATSQAVFQYHL